LETQVSWQIQSKKNCAAVQCLNQAEPRSSFGLHELVGRKPITAKQAPVAWMRAHDVNGLGLWIDEKEFRTPAEHRQIALVVGVPAKRLRLGRFVR
jgi:hypothetical protein